MPKKVVLTVGAIIVLIIIVILAMTQFGKSAKPQESISQEEVNSSDSLSKNSIKSLLGLEKNLNCTFSYPDGKSKGTVYVSGNKVRGDFSVAVDNRDMESHMIQDGSYSYIWSGQEGSKFKIDETVKASPTTSSDQVDLDKEVDMKCLPWTIDNSKFAVPADVKFTDISQMMMKVDDMKGKEGNMMDKSACEQITDPQAKAACQSSLGN